MTHDKRGRISINATGAWHLYWGNRPLPIGSRACGTVTRGSGDTGALLQTATGVYVQGNAGVLRALDQRKIGVALAA